MKGEILLIEQLSQRDLLNLSLTSKDVNQAVYPEVFRDFTVVSTHRKHYDVSQGRFDKPHLSRSGALVRSIGIYNFIRNLKFEAPEHTHPDLERSLGSRFFAISMATRRIKEDMEFLELHRNLAEVLARLPSNSLQSFRYVHSNIKSSTPGFTLTE